MSVAFDSNVTLTLEIAFDSDPLATSPSYTDISSYLRTFNINRGRANELGEFVAGNMQFSVSNADNRFNPSNTSSPYYDSSAGKSKIQPLKRVRISAVYDSSTYRLFTGFLDTVPVKYIAHGADSIVTFTAVDAFRLFQNQTIQSVGWRLGTAGFSELGQSTRIGYVDVQELTSTRVGRLLDSIGFPSADRTINAGTKQIQQQAITTNLLTALRECETAENGQFFMAGDGKAMFRNRAYKYTNAKATTVQGTFDNSGSNLPYTNVATSFDTNEVINVYEWTRTGGSTQYIADADSVISYTALSSTKSTKNINDSDVLSIIQEKLAETAIPILRIDSITMNPRQDVNLWSKTLGLELGDRVKVNITNPDSSTFSDELFVESIKHSVHSGNQSWQYQLTLSPAGSSAWVLGQAKLGEGTRFAYS